jgi:hypothetical protein
MFQACYVDEILDLAGRPAPHVLVPVRQLRERARVKRDRLREVELDRVAPRQEHLLHNAGDEFVLHELCGERRADEQPSEPFRALAVEPALAERGFPEVADIGPSS